MKIAVIKYVSLLSAWWLAISGFAAPSSTGEDMTAYAAIGVIEKISPDLGNVTIHHHAIPGYMMEMTMDFPVKNTNDLAGVSPGDEITFNLVVGTNDDWVEDLHRTGHTINPATNVLSLPTAMAQMTMPAELGPGDLLPDYTLTTEQGKSIHFSDFRGQALAFTFFFTRCPLPDYCPRMNNDFAETRRLLQADTNAPANWQFLSISFDPGFDTPEVLSNYAGLYRGEDSDRWLFATAAGPALHNLAASLDLIVTRQGNNISHNLRTVVLDPRGRIFRQLDGNSWTAEDLAGALKNAARLKSAGK
jgi:protein SCO1/2